MLKEDIDSRPVQPVAAENLCISPAAATVAPNNHIQMQSSPTTAPDASAVASAANGSGKAIVLSNNSTGSVEPPFSSLADLKREIISSRRHSPRRGGGGPPGSPMRATRTSSNYPLPAASAEYVLVAQKRAWAQVGNGRRRDDPETSPRRLAQGSSLDDEPPSRKTVLATKDNLSGSSSLPPVVTREQGGQEYGGIEAFVAETSSRMIPVAYVEATTVIRTDEVEAGASMKRRRTIITYLMLTGVVLLTIVIVPVAVTTPRKTVTIRAPTLAPTSSPTMGPTAQLIPQLAYDLKDFVFDWNDL
jgi:hypothetical protein